jgi:gluconokinase
MASGRPLTDEDREPWLRSIAAWIGEREQARETAVVTCSALRRGYRDILRHGHPSVVFVHFAPDRAELERRLASRAGHYMPASLLPSQLATLEPLEGDEPGFEVTSIEGPDAVADEIVNRLSGGIPWTDPDPDPPAPPGYPGDQHPTETHRPRLRGRRFDR